jgi:hypothetical protein
MRPGLPPGVAVLEWVGRTVSVLVPVSDGRRSLLRWDPRASLDPGRRQKKGGCGDTSDMNHFANGGSCSQGATITSVLPSNCSPGQRLSTHAMAR